MPLTKEFKETIMVDLQDREFRGAYLADAVESLHGGEFSVGKRMLRNYINATIGFDALGKAMGSPGKSLMRMLSETNTPRAHQLFRILKNLRQIDWFEISVVPRGLRESRPAALRSSGKK